MRRVLYKSGKTQRCLRSVCDEKDVYRVFAYPSVRHERIVNFSVSCGLELIYEVNSDIIICQIIIFRSGSVLL